MKKRLLLIFYAGLALSGCTQNKNNPKEGITQNIEAGKFKELIEKNNGIILDVRTPEEVEQGYIQGASTINFYDEDFGEKINFIAKDKPVYVYCRSGGRSAQAAELLIKSGITEVFNLIGGISSWEENGFKIVKPDGFVDENIKQLSLTDFNNQLKSDKPILADFHTKWCVPCKKMAPVVDSISKIFEGRATVIRIDIDSSKEVAKHFKIQGIPVFILFKNGKELWKENGIISQENLIKKMEENL